MASSQSQHGLGTSASSFDTDADADAEYNELLRYPSNVDYYSILGVSRQPPPTEAQLRSAYHNLSLSFHPDKQPSHLVEVAQEQFRRIQDAYETLSDPKKRIVYDLEGEEGVKREWGKRGLMGNMKVQNQSQVGHRTMQPAEFRRWYLAKMKAREREFLESLVGARGSVSIGIDASSLVSSSEEEGYVQLNFPTIRPNRFGLGYTFRTALPDFSGLWAFFSGNRRDAEEEEGLQQDEKGGMPEITIHATVNGTIRQMTRKVQVQYEDGTLDNVQIPSPLRLGLAAFGLSASINHQITDVGLRTGAQSKLWSFFDGAAIGGNATIFPSRKLSMYIEKSVSPFPHGKPFNVNVSCTMPPSPSHCMPILSTAISRPFGPRNFGVLAYSSGLHMWPLFVQNMFSTLMNVSPDPTLPILLATQPSSLQLKYVNVLDVTPKAEDLDDQNSLPKRDMYQWLVSAYPEGGSLGFLYARNFFTDKIEDPPRSEWNLDGYHPSYFSQSRRGVLIETEATVTLDGQMQWSISALRRVGTASSIGLGFSVREASGLVMSVSWRRLGQSIKVPILICPMDLVDAELSLWAVMVPWLTYLGIEFGYIRPQERRRRREAINRKRKLLKSQIPMRKKESAQHIEMMRELVTRRQERERDRNGLVVEKAEYGYLPPENYAGRVDELAQPKLIDVTIPLAAQVDKSQLFISKNTIRFQIIGFYDPAPLLPKTLRIWYTFTGQQFYAEVRDGEDLACPRREHLDVRGA